SSFRCISVKTLSVPLIRGSVSTGEKSLSSRNGGVWKWHRRPFPLAVLRDWRMMESQNQRGMARPDGQEIRPIDWGDLRGADRSGGQRGRGGAREYGLSRARRGGSGRRPG